MRLVPALAAAAAAALTAGAALACSCAPAESAAEHLAMSDVVFKGRVVGTQASGPFSASTRFRVVEVLKGRAAGEVRIRHTLDGASCGVRFKRGSTVLVFAHRAPDGSLGTGLCALARFPEAEYRRAARGHSVPVSPRLM